MHLPQGKEILQFQHQIRILRIKTRLIPTFETNYSLLWNLYVFSIQFRWRTKKSQVWIFTQYTSIGSHRVHNINSYLCDYYSVIGCFIVASIAIIGRLGLYDHYFVCHINIAAILIIILIWFPAIIYLDVLFHSICTNINIILLIVFLCLYSFLIGILRLILRFIRNILQSFCIFNWWYRYYSFYFAVDCDYQMDWIAFVFDALSFVIFLDASYYCYHCCYFSLFIFIHDHVTIIAIIHCHIIWRHSYYSSLMSVT